MASINPLITRICDGLKAYWELCEDDGYDSLFTNYCTENGLDDASMNEELDPDNFEDFDWIDCFTEECGDDLDDFPFEDIDDCERSFEWKTRFIFDLLCRLKEADDDSNINAVIKPPVPQLTKDAFESVGEDQVERTRMLYEKQIPLLWNHGIGGDGNLVHVLSIGHYHRFDFLLHLTDSFNRWRVCKLKAMESMKAEDEESEEELDHIHTVEDWANPDTNAHFKKFENVMITVFCDDDDEDDAKTDVEPQRERRSRNESDGKMDKGAKPYHVVIQCAVECYLKRIMPKLNIHSSLIKLNASLEVTVKYLESAARFVSNQIQTSKFGGGAACPFQFDVVMAMGEPIEMDDIPTYGGRRRYDDDTKSDDDDDDDDGNGQPHDLEDGPFRDYIGDIEAKLKANKLKYAASIKLKDEMKPGRFQELFEKLSGNKSSYTQHRRMVAMVDLRASQSVYDRKWDDPKFKRPRPKQRPDHGIKERMFMFEPPEIARDIPRDGVAEWFMAASKLCLLPDMEFDNGAKIKDAANVIEDDHGPSAKQDTAANAARNVTIGTHFPAKGSILTFSFHAREDRVIKLYLYFNGQCIRFMPQDVRDLLPRLFNMKFLGNTEWFEGRKEQRKEVDGYIERLRAILVDEQFEAFQKQYECE